MSLSVGLVSFRVVWYILRVGIVLFNAAQCRICLGLRSHCVGVVLFRVVWCRINVVEFPISVRFSVGLLPFNLGLAWFRVVWCRISFRLTSF